MSRVPSHARQGLHHLARGKAKALDRSRGAGASALRLGLSKLPRLATPLRSRCDDDEPSLVREIAIGVFVAALVKGAETAAQYVVSGLFEGSEAESEGIEVDVDLLADAVAERLGSRVSSDCDDCGCADCQCDCHGDEEE